MYTVYYIHSEMIPNLSSTYRVFYLSHVKVLMTTSFGYMDGINAEEEEEVYVRN